MGTGFIVSERVVVVMGIVVVLVVVDGIGSIVDSLDFCTFHRDKSEGEGTGTFTFRFPVFSVVFKESMF